jgi:hypothetical protein
MPEELVKLIRCPIDTNCSECRKDLNFGVWAYFNAETNEAICVQCGTKKGWSSKDRVKNIIKAMELELDIKALRGMKKVETNALLLLRKEVKLYRLGERDLELEQQILKLMGTVQDYFKECGTSKEKEALDRVFEVIRETQTLQKEVREQVQSRTFLMQRQRKKLKKQGALLEGEIE